MRPSLFARTRSHVYSYVCSQFSAWGSLANYRHHPPRTWCHAHPEGKTPYELESLSPPTPHGLRPMVYSVLMEVKRDTKIQGFRVAPKTPVHTTTSPTLGTRLLLSYLKCIQCFLRHGNFSSLGVHWVFVVFLFRALVLKGEEKMDGRKKYLSFLPLKKLNSCDFPKVIRICLIERS